ncbi:MAG TPA: hypothetical protein VMW56_22585, partial [Candidatus Margulisiibacteriota bacterium]|nr:hypothetical protein [Candidatus Margulisiibacteriota bacterium]
MPISYSASGGIFAVRCLTAGDASGSFLATDSDGGQTASTTIHFLVSPPRVTSEAGLCSDGIDNDADGAVDCYDTDCKGDPACAPNGCGNGVVDPGEECDVCITQ